MDSEQNQCGLLNSGRTTDLFYSACLNVKREAGLPQSYRDSGLSEDMISGRKVKW